MLPRGDLGFHVLSVVDAPVEALGAQHADFDLDHVQPAGVLGRVVEFQATDHAPGFGGWERLVQGGDGVGGEIVEHHADAVGLRKMHVYKFAHALSEVVCGAPVRNFDMAPGAMGIEQDEQIERAVAPIFVVVALRRECPIFRV